MTQREQLASVLQETAAGTLLLIQVQPKARRSGVSGLHAGRLKVAVTEPPDKGKATAAVLELLADTLDIPVSRLAVRRGEISRLKDICIEGVSAMVILERLVRVLAEAK